MWQVWTKEEIDLERTSVIINKIKYMESQGKIKIDFSNNTETSHDTLSGVFSEPADPLFYKALRGLQTSVKNILELPDEMECRLEPFAVSFNYSTDGRMGAVISSNLSIPSLKKTAVISTPLMRCYDGGKDEAKCFSHTTTQKLWILEKEARRYLAGERAQQNLFDNDGVQSDNTTPQFDNAELPPAQPALSEA